MKLLTGLFMAAKRRLMTTDNGAESFKTALDEIIAKKDTLSPEEIGKRIDELKKLTDDLPESDRKSQLLRYRVSIHAPAQGATTPPDGTIPVIAFQFTLPRRERQYSSYFFVI